MKKNSKMKTQYKSFIFHEKAPYEMVFNEMENTSQFVTLSKEDGVSEFRDSLIVDGVMVRPYPPDNDLVKNKVVLFPSMPVPYGTEKELVDEIQAFIHKYLEISPFFEKLTPFYVLFTWIFDHFKELPYLRALADFGCGKSRFLKVIGSVCYKPMFTFGATNAAPIFRIIDQFRGTLILDEADLRFSDTNIEIIKILNNGFQEGMSVLRCADGSQNHEVRAYDVFCPKIVATRNKFEDKALESRFLIEYMDGKLTRNDIPLNLDDEFYKKALEIRNKCLMWRLINYGNAIKGNISLDPSIQPRLNQIISPLGSIIADQETRKQLVDFIRDYNKDLIIDKGLSFESPILETVIRLMAETEGDITMKSISERYNNDCLVAGERGLSARKVGSILKDKFRFQTTRTRDGYVLVRESYLRHIDRLCNNFGINRELVNVVNVVQGDDKIKDILDQIGYRP